MGSQGPIIICLAVFFVFLLALVWWREYRSQKATEEYEKQVAKEEAKFKRQVKSLVKQRERQHIAANVTQENIWRTMTTDNGQVVWVNILTGQHSFTNPLEAVENGNSPSGDISYGAIDAPYA